MTHCEQLTRALAEIESLKRENEQLRSKGTEMRKPCPFCWSEGYTSYLGGSKHYVFCRNCGATGPVAHTPDDALRLWNKRVKRIEDEK